MKKSRLEDRFSFSLGEGETPFQLLIHVEPMGSEARRTTTGNEIRLVKEQEADAAEGEVVDDKKE